MQAGVTAWQSVAFAERGGRFFASRLCFREPRLPSSLSPTLKHPPCTRVSCSQVPHGAETLWFVNPPVLQSVPAIWHAHILVRQQAGGAAAQQQQEDSGQRQLVHTQTAK